MRRALIAAVVLIGLTGCAGTTMHDAAVARDECHDLGGIFTSWKNDFGHYKWECDLSDEVTK